MKGGLRMAGIHDGHRQRMKERFLKEGMLHMQPHEVLELLLFYTIPRKNTNELAHTLLHTFGTLAGVLEAPRADLLKVPGVGAETATFLSMMLPIMQAYKCSSIEERKVLKTLTECGDFLLAQYFGATLEQASIICLNQLFEVQAFIWLGTGTLREVEFSAKTIMAAVTRQECDYVVLAHNHPSNLLVPSLLDVELTKHVRGLLETIGVHMIDHIIVGRDDFISMASSNWYNDLFK